MNKIKYKIKNIKKIKIKAYVFSIYLFALHGNEMFAKLVLTVPNRLVAILTGSKSIFFQFENK